MSQISDIAKRFRQSPAALIYAARAAAGSVSVATLLRLYTVMFAVTVLGAVGGGLLLGADWSGIVGSLVGMTAGFAIGIWIVHR